MNEHTQWNTEGWRDHEPSNNLRESILNLAAQSSPVYRRRWFALGLIGSGLGAAALSGVFLFAASPISLAQVIAADDKANSVTIVNRRIMGPEKGGGFSVITKQVGKYWRVESRTQTNSVNDGAVSYGDGEISIGFRPTLNLATIDGASKHYSLVAGRPKVSSLLKDFKAAKVQKNFDWNGRKVTRFTYKAKVHGTDIDEELLVDPATNLPIRFLSMRDHRSWGDEWTYDYSTIDPASLKPEIPKGTEVIDNREQRKKMTVAVENNQNTMPFAAVSPFQIAIFVDPSNVPTIMSEMRLEYQGADGKSHKVDGYAWGANRVAIQSAVKDKTHYHLFGGPVNIAKRDLEMLVFNTPDLNSWKQNWLKDHLTGTLKIGKKSYKVENVDVIRVGEVYRATDPFFKD